MMILWNACLLAVFGSLMLAPFAMRRAKVAAKATQGGKS